MRVVAIDLSLTSTGYAVWEEGRGIVRHGRIVMKVAPPKTVEGHLGRFERLALEIIDTAGIRLHDVVVIEGLSMHSKSSSLDKIIGNWWIAVREIVRVVIPPVILVTPGQRAKYATGKGNAGKDEVMLATARRYPNLLINNNDEADAVILAAMGARAFGHPIEESLPAAHLEPISKIDWGIQKESPAS
jgi:crossover junction endodeoxyribonuclease RuvC